jgi:hypothetical protein
VETGPIVDEIVEVWDKIAEDLAKNDVSSAAAKLRRHLEFVSVELADAIGAEVKFKADGGYDMGELLSSVISRQGQLLSDAAKAAKYWDDEGEIDKVKSLRDARTAILKVKGGEEWVVNKAIHWNQWAQLSRNDFRPVVEVFKQLLQQFRCTKAKCDSWLTLTPRHDPVELRCLCGALRLNLKMK